MVCVDANLIVRTLLPGPFRREALTLFEYWQRKKIALIAPSLLAFEVTSTIRHLVFLKEIPLACGEEALANFLRMPIRLSTRRGIFPLAWKLAAEFSRPRAYDTAYLALARLLGCEFWTADEKLYNAVRDKFKWVKWIGEML